MQIDDNSPVHLNVYINKFKQWWHVKKYKNIMLVPSLRRDGYAYATDGGHRRISWWQYTAW